MTDLAEDELLERIVPLLPSQRISDDFFIARAAAIRCYADYEFSLVMFFAYLMNVSPDYAGVPFFKLTSARARLDTISRLLKKRHGNEYNKYWNSLFDLLRKLDGKRNEIIHWPIKVTIDADQGGKPTKLVLVPANYMDMAENSLEITLLDLYDFIVKCDFLARSINVFHMFISGHSDAWRDICLQPVSYPPHDNHPLFQIPTTP